MYMGGTGSLTFTAATDSTLYACPASAWQDVVELIKGNRDYGAYVSTRSAALSSTHIGSLKTCSPIMMRQREYLTIFVLTMLLLLRNTVLTGSQALFRTSSRHPDPSEGVRYIHTLQFSRQFIEPSAASPDERGVSGKISSAKGIDYYRHLYSIPADIVKAFFSADSYVAVKHAAMHPNILTACLKSCVRSSYPMRS
jgi:hypothetical protein